MKTFSLTTIITGLLSITQLFAQSDSNDKLKFTPIRHATFVIETSDATIYVDPVGDVSAFSDFTDPDIILITDIHGDHLNADVINSLKTDKTTIITPKAAYDILGYGEILNNGENTKVDNINVEAIPMYNTTKERLDFHPKGRGNGYVLSVDGKRIYISGDTEDIKEMRELKNIDYAFVCMNLPYTMTVEQAASAVLEFKPKVVFPYHYRGSDIEKFKQLVSANKDIEVRLLDWYK